MVCTNPLSTKALRHLTRDSRRNSQLARLVQQELNLDLEDPSSSTETNPVFYALATTIYYLAYPIDRIYEILKLKQPNSKQ